MGGSDRESRLGLLSGYLDRWQGPPEPAESRMHRQELESEEQRAKRWRLVLSWLKSMSKIEHLSDDEFGAAFEEMLSRLGVGMQEDPTTRYFEILAAMLPSMPEFKRKRQRPNLPRGRGGIKYDRYRAVHAFRREKSGTEELSQAEIVRRLIAGRHPLFAGYSEETMVKDVSAGKRIFEEARRKSEEMRAMESGGS